MAILLYKTAIRAYAIYKLSNYTAPFLIQVLSSIINNPDNKALFNSEYSSPVNYLSLANAAVIAYNSMANNTIYFILTSG